MIAGIYSDLLQDAANVCAVLTFVAAIGGLIVKLWRKPPSPPTPPLEPGE